MNCVLMERPGSIGSNHHFLPQFLLALDLRQKHFLSLLSTMHVAWWQLARQTVSFPIEQQQRGIAVGHKMRITPRIYLSCRPARKAGYHYRDNWG
jgi:hypothetical protein